MPPASLRATRSSVSALLGHRSAKYWRGCQCIWRRVRCGMVPDDTEKHNLHAAWLHPRLLQGSLSTFQIEMIRFSCSFVLVQYSSLDHKHDTPLGSIHSMSSSWWALRLSWFLDSLVLLGADLKLKSKNAKRNPKQYYAHTLRSRGTGEVKTDTHLHTQKKLEFENRSKLQNQLHRTSSSRWTLSSKPEIIARLCTTSWESNRLVGSQID